MDPLVRALATASPAEARAIYQALAQYLDNNDPDECNDPRPGEPVWSDPELYAAARSMQDRLDAAMIEGA